MILQKFALAYGHAVLGEEDDTPFEINSTAYHISLQHVPKWIAFCKPVSICSEIVSDDTAPILLGFREGYS